jgi:TonB family protein
MPKQMTPKCLPAILLLTLCAAPSALCVERAGAASRFSTRLHAARAANEREQDGLVGPVRRVKTETAKITVKNGKPVEGPRTVLETITYDNKGARVDSAYFLTAGGTLTGKEIYKYDERGNMVEMTLHDTDGSLLAKETYSYEFDAVGNWVKMTTAVGVVEGGKLTFEPTEVTYRTIAYFLEEKTAAKFSQPLARTTIQPAPATTGQPGSATKEPAQAAAPAPQPASSQAAAKLATPQAVSAPSASSQTGSPQLAQKAPDNVAVKTADSGASVPQQIAAVPPDRSAATTRQPATAMPAASLPNPPAGASVKPEDAVKPEAAKPEAGAKPETAKAEAAKTEGESVARTEGEAAARPVVRGPLKPVSGGILNGKAINLPTPQYPDMARRAAVSGVVEVEVLIDVSGKVISAKASKGPVMLQQAAEQAARQAKFVPTLLSGQPVKVSGSITYNFTLR